MFQNNSIFGQNTPLAVVKNKTIGSSFDDFLAEEGISEEVEAGAIKKIIAYQLQETIKREHLSKTALAARLETSRSAVDRLLDPLNDSSTLSSLIKAANVLGKILRLELV
jgi:predicted XRE-type DNA-binding protein